MNLEYEMDKTPQELLMERLQDEKDLYMKHIEMNQEKYAPYIEEIQTEYGPSKRINFERLEADGKLREYQNDQLMSFQEGMSIAVLTEAAIEQGLTDEVIPYGLDADSMVNNFENNRELLFGNLVNEPCIFGYANAEAKTTDNLNPATYPVVLGKPVLNEAGEPVNIAGMSVREQVNLYKEELNKQLGVSRSR